jgi:hypothetical protein
MNNKYISMVFSVLFFNSCSLIDSSRIAPGYIEAFNTIKGVLVGYENDQITPELVSNIPYASSILKIGKGAPGLIILESQNGNENTWVSSDGIYIVFEEGRIVKTRGLHNNLVNSKSFRNNLKNIVTTKKTESFIYYYSYDEPELVDMKVEVERKFIRVEQVKLLGHEAELSLIEERISNEYIGWKATNKFWVDENLFIWKSYQSISPKLPEFYIEVTKKPAE